MNATARTTASPLAPHSPAAILADKYVAAMNSHNADAVARCFSPDAIVEDEGRQHTGTIPIHAWISEAFAKYQPVLKVHQITGSEGFISIIGEVSGNFDGSPITLEHQLEHDAWLITHLEIHPPE